MSRIVENCVFTQSLKGIWIYTIEQSVCKFLLVFHRSYVSILYRFWDILRRIMACLWKLIYQSFKIIENGTIRQIIIIIIIKEKIKVT